MRIVHSRLIEYGTKLGHGDRAIQKTPDFIGAPYGTRTRVFAVRGRRPGPLDEGSMRFFARESLKPKG